MIVGRSELSLAASSRNQVTQARVDQGKIWDNRSGGAAGPGDSSHGGRPSSAPTPAPRSGEVDGPARSAATVQVDAALQLGAAFQISSALQARTGTQGGSAGPDDLAGSSGLGDSGRVGQASDVDSSPEATMNAKFLVMISIVEHLTGQQVQLLDPGAISGADSSAAEAALPPGGSSGVAASAGAGQSGAARLPQGWGIDVTRTETRTEAESTEFSAEGRVTTTDGREISFSLALALQRESIEVKQYRMQAGDALVDPLVLNFGRSKVALTPSTINFDLNADGQSDRISFVADGNGFLALDRNGNGTIDDGRELFGPSTGSGFGELASYDDDGNGWIDEGDAVYSKLRIWDAEGVSSLADKGVGAISVDRVETPFPLEAGGQQAGALRETGVWLGENGSVGTVHHVDLAV